MKASEIKAGVAYTDGRGNVRLVLSEGSHTLYPMQEDHDCVRYRVLAKRRAGLLVGSEYSSTRRSFAHWAKSIVAEPAPVARGRYESSSVETFNVDCQKSIVAESADSEAKS